MWHLIEDFFEQSLVMKGFIALGWLCVLVMMVSLVFNLITEWDKAAAAKAEDSAVVWVQPIERVS